MRRLPRAGYGRSAGPPRSMPSLELPMTRVTPLAKLRVPLGGQEIELQQIDYDAGGMSLLRTRIRERQPFHGVRHRPADRRAMGRGAAGAGPRATGGSVTDVEADRAATMVDVAFPVGGRSLPRDHASPLARRAGARAAVAGRPSRWPACTGQAGARLRRARPAVAARAAAAAGAGARVPTTWRRWPAPSSAWAAGAAPRRAAAARAGAASTHCMPPSWRPRATTSSLSCAR